MLVLITLFGAVFTAIMGLFYLVRVIMIAANKRRASTADSLLFMFITTTLIVLAITLVSVLPSVGAR